MRHLFIASSVLAIAFAATPALAQNAEDGASEDAQIVVTARKREESLLNVPVPVTVATQAQLEREQVHRQHGDPEFRHG